MTRVTEGYPADQASKIWTPKTSLIFGYDQKKKKKRANTMKVKVVHGS